ncbi:MAG TPA: tripartite tricarboxylate transporter substrate-binding protein [Xanthobacteraceae bacterium]|nr:tripartite tricarboxylate transporter substrate-binding protein [Xanthobacteraceae bacterium]
MRSFVSHAERLLKRRKFLQVAIAACLGPMAGRGAIADTNPAEFYRGKTLRILVGSPPGGGYDVYARLIVQPLATKLGASVVIENNEGNGGLSALAKLLMRPADGLTIMNGSAEAAIISQMLGRPGVTWDVTKLNWLAKMAAAPKLWFVAKDSPHIPSIAAALQADPLTWPATGPADDISDVEAVISYVLGLKSKIVTGFSGSGNMSLAVIRNEVNCGLLSADSALPHLDSIKPLALFGRKRWSHLPDVPTLREAVTIPADRMWAVRLREDIGEAQRALVAPPGVPPDRVAYLRDVLAEVLADPAVVEEGARTNREIEFMSGADLQKLVGDLMEAAGPRLPEFHKIVLDTYF